MVIYSVPFGLSVVVAAFAIQFNAGLFGILLIIIAVIYCAVCFVNPKVELVGYHKKGDQCLMHVQLVPEFFGRLIRVKPTRFTVVKMDDVWTKLAGGNCLLFKDRLDEIYASVRHELELNKETIQVH